MDSASTSDSAAGDLLRGAAAWKHDLGVTVRKLRDARALTRGGLAERSGLSLRFLADVEGGKANPSLGSLHDLARALHVGVVTLVDSTTGPIDAGDAPSPVIALLGLRGAGKSTIGKRAAKALGWTFVELDAEVERDAGMSLAELFPLYGEDHYRALEAKVLTQLLGKPTPTVIATGGGIVTHDAALRLLQARTTTVWLKATPQEHWDRVLAQGDVRPMARRREARTELDRLYAERALLYARAAVTVDTSGREVAECAARVVDLGRARLQAPAQGKKARLG